MRERVEIEVDEQGRLWVPQTLGKRLGLVSGMVLVVSEEAANRAYWSIPTTRLFREPSFGSG